MVVMENDQRGQDEAQRRSHVASVSAAPGQLELVRAFVNTLDIEAGTDELASPAAVDRWLRARGLITAEQGGARREVSAQAAVDADLRDAITVREGLRAVLRAHVDPANASGGSGSRPGTVTRLGDITARLPARLALADDGRLTMVPATSGVKGGLAGILLIASEAAIAGSWARLKVCSADDCQWAFYDRSPTRNGCWCSMAVCGSRAKSRNYRRRVADRH